MIEDAPRAGRARRSKRDRVRRGRLSGRFTAAAPLILVLGLLGCAATPPEPHKLPSPIASIEPAAAPVALPPVVEPVAEARPTAPTQPPISIDPARTAFVADRRLEGMAVSYYLVDLATGEPLDGYDPDQALIPASTTKLATALAALDLLGPDHRFRTELLVDGTIDAGRLEGDLILKGAGDPSLDLADLLELVIALRQRGITAVDGRFLVDDTALPRFTEIASDQPLEAPYNPGISALSLAFNRVELTWQGGRELDALTMPPLAEAQFAHAATADLPPRGVALNPDADEGVLWQLADRGKRRQRTSLPVKDPTLHAGRLFRRFAADQGIAMAPPERGAAGAAAWRLATHESRELRHLLRDMLVYSNNAMAELIGMSAAETLGRPTLDLTATSETLRQHLAAAIGDTDFESFVIGNHSGLDSEARATARQLVGLVRLGWDNGMLPQLLPGSGWTGTLSDRLDHRDQALRVWAKTGAINYGTALAGYVLAPGRRPAAFAIMVSDLAARRAYDELTRPTRATEARANAWRKAAQVLQDEIVAIWLDSSSVEQAVAGAKPSSSQGG
jgi:D-alanyl-D-alanine carboxypeptidase/D-alanyl-D-alanine-endopeptidase (penicillin-binding protein 4)